MMNNQKQEGFSVETIKEFKVNGIVDDLRIQKYASGITAVIRLRYARGGDNTSFSDPISIEFPYADECPIKLGDWLTVSTKVERLD